MKLDLKDLKILSLLDQNARLSVIQIAKKLRLNKDVVRYRISNLEKDKIINGYYTIINTNKIGYTAFRIYLDFININDEIEKRIINSLDQEIGAGQIFSLEGEYQLGAIFWEKSIYDLEKKIQLFKKNFGDYINKLDLSIFTKINHYFKKNLPVYSKKIISLKNENIVKLDDTDFKILHTLSKNSRISFVEMSSKLNIPERTIAFRVRQLEKKEIILAYRADINVNKLGYENYFIGIYTGSKQNLAQIETFANLNKNCIYSDYILSGADIELETEFKNKKELLEFINSLKKKFIFIKKIKYWSTLEYLKLNYLPEIFGAARI